MAENRRRIPVPRDAVWRVLSDGNTYARWVVGTSQIRGVDDNWPAPGARLHYRIGRGPLRHDGHTEVLSADPGRCLELEAHAWPLGTVRIVLTLVEAAGCCIVTIVEHPARGVLGLLHNPIGDGLLKLRNVEALRRLDRLAREQHGAAQPSAAQP